MYIGPGMYVVVIRGRRTQWDAQYSGTVPSGLGRMMMKHGAQVGLATMLQYPVETLRSTAGTYFFVR